MFFNINRTLTSLKETYSYGDNHYTSDDYEDKEFNEMRFGTYEFLLGIRRISQKGFFLDFKLPFFGIPADLGYTIRSIGRIGELFFFHSMSVPVVSLGYLFDSYPMLSHIL